MGKTPAPPDFGHGPGPQQPMTSKDWPKAEMQVLEALCWCRQYPQAAAELCKEKLELFEGNDMLMPDGNLLETNEGPKAVLDAIKFLENQEPLSEIKQENIPGLKLSAMDHVNDLGPKGITSHAGSNGSTPQQRMNRYGYWTGMSGECIWYGEPFDGMDIVLSLIIDDGVADRGHRKIIYTKNFNVCGVGIGLHSTFEAMAVLNFATGFQVEIVKLEFRQKNGYSERTEPEPYINPLLNQMRPSAQTFESGQSKDGKSSKKSSKTKDSSDDKKSKKSSDKKSKKSSREGGSDDESSKRGASQRSPTQFGGDARNNQASMRRPSMFQQRPDLVHGAADQGVGSPPPSAGNNICVRCDVHVGHGAVFTTSRGKWHPSCFTCSICDRNLANLTFNVHKLTEYCQECYRNNVIPQCYRCSKPLLGTYVNFNGDNFHNDCFDRERSMVHSRKSRAARHDAMNVFSQ